MNTAIGFALLSLMFAGIIDVVYKRFSLGMRSRGIYVAGIGIVWGACQIIALGASDTGFAWHAVSMGYGLAGGLVLTLSNILLIESLRHLNVSLGSTIYRLNTIGVVILSFFFLHEPIGFLKAAGIACGIVGVLMLAPHRPAAGLASAAPFCLTGAIMASFFRAAYGVLTKVGIVNGADPKTMLMITAGCWIAGGVAYAGLHEKKWDLSLPLAGYCVLSGVLCFCIANFLVLAIAQGEATVVIPVANMSFVMALLISLGLKMETLSPKKGVAMLFAAGSIVFLAQV